MMLFMKIMAVLAYSFLSLKVLSASYDTLPMGVNTFVFKQVATSKIESKYNANNNNESLLINETFSTSNLSNISDAINSYFEELKKISPDAYNAFSLGEFEAKASATVNAQGIGLGRGITDRFTVFGSLPIYHLKTNVNFYQKNSSNLNQVKNALINSNPTTAIGTFVKQLTLQLPDSNEELLQSVLVNYYNYKPLGTWEKDALGDAEIGFIYRLTNQANMGSALSMGLVLPTGSVDDPDSLQDVSTGDGQTDVFIESMNGIGLFNNTILFDIKGKYTYQFEGEKRVRLYNDPDVPLSKESTTVREKLGNKIETTSSITFNANQWLSFSGSYIYSSIGKSSYKLNDEKIKKALEANTDTIGEWAKVSVGLSTIELYKSKKFEMPLEVIFSGQKLINAKNTADYNRFDIDFKMYF
jgi:hypothetical protein